MPAIRLVRRLRRKLGRPVRILKVMGLRAVESRDRAHHPAYRNILTNGARIVDEWLPVKDWPTAAVLEWHQDAPMPHHWTYDGAVTLWGLQVPASVSDMVGPRSGPAFRPWWVGRQRWCSGPGPQSGWSSRLGSRVRSSVLSG